MNNWAYKSEITSQFFTLVSKKSLNLNNQELEKEIKLFNGRATLGLFGVTALGFLVTIRCDKVIRSFMSTPARILVAFCSINFLPFGSRIVIEREAVERFSNIAFEYEEKILELTPALRELKAKESPKPFAGHPGSQMSPSYTLQENLALVSQKSNEPGEYQEDQSDKQYGLSQGFGGDYSKNQNQNTYAGYNRNDEQVVKRPYQDPYTRNLNNGDFNKGSDTYTRSYSNEIITRDENYGSSSGSYVNNDNMPKNQPLSYNSNTSSKYSPPNNRFGNQKKPEGSGLNDVDKEHEDFFRNDPYRNDEKNPGEKENPPVEPYNPYAYHINQAKKNTPVYKRPGN